MATSERLKMAFNSDQIRFRDNYLDRYEDHWYNVSTLKLDANQYGFKKPIDDFQRRYLALDKELKDSLKPFKIEEAIECLKKKYTPHVTIERLGDKDTWKKIDKSKEELRFFEERIKNASIIVCMVQVVYDRGIVRITQPSSDLLQKCLAEQPDDTEIVIITQPGIHAIESKSIVYKTLEERKVKLPKAVHHAAEIDIHDIVLGRVNLLMKNIGELATTLIKSLPDSIRTSKFVTESFEEHTREQNQTSNMRKGLQVLTLKGYDPCNYQHYDDRDYWLYSDSTYYYHKKTRKNYQLEVSDTELEQHTMKTVVVPKEENKRIYEYLIEKKPKMTSEKRNKIHNIISAASERLFTMHSNLSVIEPSAVKSSKDGENIIDCPCIAIVCIRKGTRPIGEPLFPTEIEGIKIDVREGFYIPFTCHSCSVGVEEIKSTGSYGFLAHKTGNRSKEGIITSAHVVVEDDVVSDIFESTKVTLQRHELKNERVELFSPSSLDSNIPKRERIYGIVCDIYCGEWQNDGSQEQSGVEAAFVEKSEESQVTLNFHITSGQWSHPIFDPKEILDGHVEKCGRTTGHTTGEIIETNCSIKWDIPSKPFITLKSQYKIGSKEAFAEGGDSGSGVYLVRNDMCHPIGIVEGGLLENGHCEQWYVTPIGSILGALDLHIIPENGIIDTTHVEN